MIILDTVDSRSINEADLVTESKCAGGLRSAPLASKRNNISTAKAQLSFTQAS